jgi:hypothetical protein
MTVPQRRPTLHVLLPQCDTIWNQRHANSKFLPAIFSAWALGSGQDVVDVGGLSGGVVG